MDDHIRDVYLFEAIQQCRFGLNAYRGLRNVLPRLLSGAQELDYATRTTLHNEVFRSIHSLLTHASNVSRLFWPPTAQKRRGESRQAFVERKAKHPPTLRSRSLREAVGLPAQRALTKRELRDHLEHFDERLDLWARESIRKSFVQDLIGGPNSIAGIDPGDMMRWFDPEAMLMRFTGKEYPLRPVTDGLAEVSDKCVAVLSKSGCASAFQEIERIPPHPPAAG